MRLILTILCVLSLIAYAFYKPATVQNVVIRNDRPHLIVNHDNTLCAPFLDAMQNVFDGSEPEKKVRLDVKNYFPKDEVFFFDSSYDRGYFFESAIEGKADKRLFYLRPIYRGWRTLGSYLDIVRNVGAVYNEFGHDILTKEYHVPREYINGQRAVDKEWFQKITQFDPIDKLYFISRNNRLYAFPILTSVSTNRASVAYIMEIEESASTTVCEVQFLPPSRKYEKPLNQTPLTELFANIYGYRAGCHGTMGWTADPLIYPLSDIFERPWVIEGLVDEKWNESEAAAQLRLMSWGLSDPISWRNYLKIESAYPTFIALLSDYYVQNFNYSAERANILARRSYRYWLDNLIYNHSDDLIRLPNLAHYDVDSKFKPAAQMMNDVFDKWSKSDDMVLRSKQFGKETFVKEYIAALIYTQAGIEKVDAVYKGFNEYREKYPPNYDVGIDNKDMGDSGFLAAIGDVNLMGYMLKKGGNVNSRTNGFKKTPLMYAAQLNEFESVVFLIERGADVNLKTYGEFCFSLERDNRTALMYAVENADAKMIFYLVDKGADVSATDSKGNDVLWYLGRNTVVTDPSERRSVISKLSIAKNDKK